MDIEMRHLRVINALAEAGSVSEASRRLQVPQPALTRQLQRIEVSLGYPLFQRTRDGLTATTRGLWFVERARELTDSFDHLVQAGGGPPAVPSTLRFATYCLPIGGALQHLAPTMGVTAVSTQEAASLEDALAQLTAAEVDLVGYLHWPHTPDPAIPSTMRALTIVSEPMTLMLPINHPAVEIPDPDLALFAEDDWIARPGLPTTEAECRRAGFVPRITHHYENHTYYFSLVGSGQAIAFCSPTTHVTANIAVRQYHNSSSLVWGLVYNPQRFPDTAAHQIRDFVRHQRHLLLVSLRSLPTASDGLDHHVNGDKRTSDQTAGEA